jgi:hypothetical protein
VLREVEEAAVRALHLFYPVVGTGHLRGGFSYSAERETGRGDGSEHATEEATAIGLVC